MIIAVSAIRGIFVGHLEHAETMVAFLASDAKLTGWMGRKGENKTNKKTNAIFLS